MSENKSEKKINRCKVYTFTHILKRSNTNTFREKTGVNQLYTTLHLTTLVKYQ